MREPKPFSALTGFAVAALVVVLAGAGVAFWTGFNLRQRSPDGLVNPEKPDVAAPGQAQTYWLSPAPQDETAIAFVPQNVLAHGKSPEMQLRQALTTLLEAPATTATAIPAETKLLSLQRTDAGIRIDLSQEFSQGGGSDSMIARLGQVIYTATSLDPNQPVWLSVQGQPLTVLGGEGLMVAQPITRGKFQTDFMARDR